MKVAVFGGSGFLGYDFVRCALRRGGVDLVVYSTSANSLANVSRHDVDLRLYSANEPHAVVLDDDTDVVVDFAHPFERRGEVGGAEQIHRFVRFIAAAKRSNPRLRLIYLSSMSVFEPFMQNRRFAEADPLRPPKADRYAREKVLAETELRTLPDADRWQLHLRPTVVYGPFCRPFTDRFLELFKQGDVWYRDLSGRIQPIYGEDISRFICDRLFDFAAGVYNLAGPEEMSWQTFVEAFREIVGVSRLVQMPADSGFTDRELPPSYKDDIRQLMQVARQQPSFDRLAGRILRRLPAAASGRFKRLLFGRDAPRVAPVSDGPTANAALFGRSYFAEDRLVQATKWRRDFPTLELSRLPDVKPILERYYRFRFSDGAFV
jgi:nucleoside-diphosphate-sugar epimerase